MLKLKHITKSFGGIRALKGVDLEVIPGEIHALLGENGAGKSTLMKVISGAHQADDGFLEWDGQAIVKNSPQLAKALGISIIYQEFSLVPDLTVAENIFFGQEEMRNWVKWDELEEKAQKIIHSIGFDIAANWKVRDLSVAHQQVVEIAKALSRKVNVLILDEPSAVLGTQDVARLFELLKQLKAQGVAIIYISHHLEELLQLSDRITVLKDGKSMATVLTKDMDKNQLVSLMVGREITQLYPEKKFVQHPADQIQVRNLKHPIGRQTIEFDLYKGEILGIGGLVGAGRTEVIESLFGLGEKSVVSVDFEGLTRKHSSPRNVVAYGWGLVPEDRKKFGGHLHLSIRENISLANLQSISNRWGFIQRKKEKVIADQLVERLRIKLGSIHDPLSSLSGGNQQKVILAKWLNLDLKVLLVDEPTRGVDVGARSEIYQIMHELTNNGVYILMVSSDIEELMGVSDRILILKNGQLQGILNKEEFTEEHILRLAIGAK